jgi:hypothetical protein
LNEVLLKIKQQIPGAPQFSADQFRAAIVSLEKLGACEGAVQTLSALFHSLGSTMHRRHDRTVLLVSIDNAFKVLHNATPSEATAELCGAAADLLHSMTWQPVSNVAPIVEGLKHLPNSPETQRILQEIVVLLERAPGGPNFAKWNTLQGIDALREILSGMQSMKGNPEVESMLRFLNDDMWVVLSDPEKMPSFDRIDSATRSRVLAEAISYLQDHFESDIARQFVVTVRDWLALSTPVDPSKLTDKRYRQELIRDLSGWPRGRPE